MKKHSTSSLAENIIFLRGKKTILRPINQTDIPHFLKWMNNPEVRQYILRITPVTEDIEREWVEGLKKKSDTDVVLIIEVNGKPIGVMGIHGIKWSDRTATTGAVIGEIAHQGKGYGTDAKMTLLDYAFNTLNLRKMGSSVIAFNKRSLAYSLHCGYKIEGRKRQQIFRDGKYHDEIILGLFKHEWLPYWEAYCKKR